MKKPWEPAKHLNCFTHKYTSRKARTTVFRLAGQSAKGVRYHNCGGRNLSYPKDKPLGTRTLSISENLAGFISKP